MKNRRIPDLLIHMRDAAQDAQTFVDGMDKTDFLADRRTQQAVIMSLVIIGEAAAILLRENPDYTARHTSIPWHNMRGMRNRIAHGYFDINLEVVWDTVTHWLPELLAHLHPLIADLRDSS